MSNSVFRKAMENLRKHRDIKPVKKERTRGYLVSELNYHTEIFYRKFVKHRNEKISKTYK